MICGPICAMFPKHPKSTITQHNDMLMLDAGQAADHSTPLHPGYHPTHTNWLHLDSLLSRGLCFPNPKRPPARRLLTRQRLYVMYTVVCQMLYVFILLIKDNRILRQSEHFPPFIRRLAVHVSGRANSKNRNVQSLRITDPVSFTGFVH